MSEKYKRFDAADYLETLDDVAVFLEVALEDSAEDPSALPHALGIIARSQNMSELARRVGMSRDGLYKALSEEGNPTWLDHPQGHQRTRAALRAAHGRVSPPKYRSDTAGDPFEAEISHHEPVAGICVSAGQTAFSRDCRRRPTPLAVFELYYDI